MPSVRSRLFRHEPDVCLARGALAAFSRGQTKTVTGMAGALGMHCTAFQGASLAAMVVHGPGARRRVVLHALAAPAQLGAGLACAVATESSCARPSYRRGCAQRCSACASASACRDRVWHRCFQPSAHKRVARQPTCQAAWRNAKHAAIQVTIIPQSPLAAANNDACPQVVHVQSITSVHHSQPSALRSMLAA
jgi:hypothetical protein